MADGRCRMGTGRAPVCSRAGPVIGPSPFRHPTSAPGNPLFPAAPSLTETRPSIMQEDLGPGDPGATGLGGTSPMHIAKYRPAAGAAPEVGLVEGGKITPLGSGAT